MSSRGTLVGNCLGLCILGALCGGCIHGCLMPAFYHQREVTKERQATIERENALIAEYAPELPTAIRACEDQIASWSTDLESLSRTIRSVGKNPLADRDVVESTKVLQELRDVHAKLLGARGDLLIALKKTEVQTSKGDEETRIKRVQGLVSKAVADSKKAVRIAAAKQRQISGSMSRDELSGTNPTPNDSDPELGSVQAAKSPEESTQASPRSPTVPASPKPTPSNPKPADAPSSTDPVALDKPSSTSDVATITNLEPEVINSVGQRLILLKPGEFLMGAEKVEIDAIFAKTRSLSDKAKDRLASELPRHRVKISTPFYLGSTEVTVGQFARFIEASGYKTTAETKDSGKTWRTPGHSQGEHYPVTAISWIDAVAFCQWLSETENVVYRLPTEAEWEYACRADSKGAWHWGSKPDKLSDYAWSAGDAAKKTRPVATKEPNAFGLFDMQGNVSEWCQDWYQAGYYSQSPMNDPQGPTSGDERVIRGGSVSQSDPSFFRSSLRGSIRETAELVGVGMRVVREAKDSR